MEKKTYINSNTVFLLDAVGALITASLLSQVLARYPSYFGVPEATLQLLASIVMLFSVYSFICHLYIKRSRSLYLKIIAVLNTCYSIATLSLVIYHFDIITPLGAIYFLSEIAIILYLVSREWTISQQIP